MIWLRSKITKRTSRFSFLSPHLTAPDALSAYLWRMVYVSRKEHFNAAHRLYREDWTEEQNTAMYGPCANANWHGHNFEVIVTVKGKPDPETGFVVDMKQLSLMIKEHITEPLDHKNLNLDVPFMKGIIPSCENLIVKMWEILVPHIQALTPHAHLHQIRLYETPRNYVDYFGE